MNDGSERVELIGPEPAVALAGLLGVPVPDLEAGHGLPLTWHWIYLLERPPQSDLGVDGHPVRDAVPGPPGPGRRRMWAGGRLRRLGAMHVGEMATRRSRVLTTTEKQGHSGRLVFVTVGHEILQDGRVVVEERQDVVYRDAAPRPEPGAPVAVGERQAVGVGEWAVPVNPVFLFRFSALTYNAHRIHYDRDYARAEEGYPGLVVHGPLQAMAMVIAAGLQGRSSRSGETFEYRLKAPLFEGQGLVAGAFDDPGGMRTTVRDDWGRRTAEGRFI